MFRRRLRKLHAHSLIRMHDANQSLRADFNVASAHRQRYAARHRKWRRNFEVASAQAQIRKLAADRRIILLGLRRILLEPLTQLLRRLWRNLQEAQPGLSAIPFPGKL